MAISATLFLLPIALLHGVVNGQTQPGASCGVIGAPVKCVPLSQNVLQLVRPPAMTAATSTCDNELFCGRVDPFGTTSDVVCSTCPVVDADAVFPVGFILEDLFDVQRVPLIERSRWQSGILPSQQSSVTITGNLVRTFTMASFAFDFYHTQPQSIFVERSINNGTTYTPYIYFAVDCEASFNILPEDSPQALRPSVENPDVAVCIPITNPGQGGGVFYNLREDRIPTSTTIPLNVQTEIQIDTDANLQAWLRATDFRITLTGVTYPTGIVGNSSFNFFSAYTLSIVGQCQCFGHSTGICEAGDVPCACEHRTTGFDCSICLPGFVDVPWRPSTLREPFECQGEALTLLVGIYRSSAIQSTPICVTAINQAVANLSCDVSTCHEVQAELVSHKVRAPTIVYFCCAPGTIAPVPPVRGFLKTNRSNSVDSDRIGSCLSDARTRRT